MNSRIGGALGLSVLVTVASGCEQLAEKAKAAAEPPQVAFISSGAAVDVEGLNGPTQIEWVFSDQKRIGEFGDWPLPLAPVRIISQDEERATVEVLDPNQTPGCGHTLGGLPGLELRVTVARSELLYRREKAPEGVSIPFECLADVSNVTSSAGSWVVPHDPQLEARAEKRAKKLRRSHPRADLLPKQNQLVIAGQVPRLARGSKLQWRSGAEAGRVGDGGVHFGAFGTLKEENRVCLRDRIGIWPSGRGRKGRSEQAIQEGLIEICVDAGSYREPGMAKDADRSAPDLPQRKSRRF